MFIQSSTPRRKSGQDAGHVTEDRRKSGDIDIDEMLESPLRKLNESQVNRAGIYHLLRHTEDKVDF